MGLVRGSSRAAIVMVCIMFSRHDGADSLRRGRHGGTALHFRRRRRVYRGPMVATSVGDAAAGAEAARSKKKGSLAYSTVATRHGSLCSTMPPEAASACFTLRPDGLPRRSHGQWSWDDSGAAKERSFRTAKCAQGTRPVRGFSACPGGAISLDCARC